MIRREPSQEFLARWKSHVEREMVRADAQIARQIAVGNRDQKRRLPTVRGREEKKPDSDKLVLAPDGNLDWRAYDYIIVAFSGGKDSLACVLHLLDMGVPRDRIELWHYCVDGEPGKAPRFFDWPVTEDYCRAVAEALGIRLLFRWRQGGFEGELLKTNARTLPVTIEMLDGSRIEAGGKLGDITTQGKFPRQGSMAAGRWCSQTLKIDVGRLVFTNDPRFNGRRSLLLMGERAEESGPRSKYPDVEEDQASNSLRTVTMWHPILTWREYEVWDIIARHRVRPHPAYYVGFGRLSCMPCIFGGDDQWSTVAALDPGLLQKIAKYEQGFFRPPSWVPEHVNKKGDLVKAKWAAHPGTIHPAAKPVTPSGEGGEPTMGVEVRANRGVSYLAEEIAPDEREYAEANAQLAMSESYPREFTIIDNWELPRGAGRKSGGPT